MKSPNSTPGSVPRPGSVDAPEAGGGCRGTSLAAQHTEDDRVQPAGDLAGGAAELDLELEGLALGRLG